MKQISVEQLLSQLQNLGVKLWLQEDRLRSRAPKGVLTPILRQQIRTHKAQLMRLLRQVQGESPVTHPSVGRGNPQSAIRNPQSAIPSPLSFGQQRLWFMDQLEGANAAYHIPGALKLTGVLDRLALSRALNEIVRRHSVLRTTFGDRDGQPHQVIVSQAKFELPLVDLRHLAADEQEATVQRLANQEAQRAFDLSQDLMLRASLLQLKASEHVLLLTMHHIASDAWSLSVLMRELVTLYKAFVNHQPSPLPDLPMQYADFARWQRQQNLTGQLSYWKEQLSGDLPMLPLSTDYRPSSLHDHRGASLLRTLKPELTTALKELSLSHGATLFMTLLAAFKLLLYRYSLHEDLIVGAPMASRTLPETENLIGFFLNTLALRTTLSGPSATFEGLLGRVRQVVLDASANQELPFEQLVEELKPERSLTHHPFFDVMFNLINTPEIIVNVLPNLSVTFLELIDLDAKLPLTFHVTEQRGQLQIKLLYQRALFSRQRMTCMLEQYHYLLQQLVSDPARPIGSYSLITAKMESLLPNPRAKLPEPHYEPVTSLFMAWVEQMPTHVAVCQGGKCWSYRELADCAVALAEALLMQGLQKGDVVAVDAPPSFGLIVTLLAILMSGGLFLTLDANHPQARQQLMLEEAGATYLISLHGELFIVSRIRHIRAKGEGTRSNDFSRSQLSTTEVVTTSPFPLHGEQKKGLDAVTLPQILPEDKAYIFFTSGTTGVPKGVLGWHKGISHFVAWQRKTFAVGASDRIALLTTLSFDALLREIFLPLTSGATLHLPTKQQVAEPNRLLSWLEEQQITILNTVPSRAQSWLTQRSREEVPTPSPTPSIGIRLVFFSGEPLSDAFIEAWRALFSARGTIINLYGPTETTMTKCYYEVPTPPAPGVQPIGYPMPQTQALILRERQHLCGIGEIGEIVLRTPFRTLGYINSPHQNQARFVQNPFRSESTAPLSLASAPSAPSAPSIPPQLLDASDLLYYTGDLGRYRPDGSLEILGRLDDQVKIRGVRVELAEIKSLLEGHAALSQSVVVARQRQGADDKELVAYIVPKAGQALQRLRLRSYLAQWLPSAMVPRFFVQLETLPLLPNGKVNRRALPEPAVELTGDIVAPRSAIEKKVAEIWQAVLDIERVGIHDNFFERGGHSLLATQVISRIRRSFEVEFPLRSLFERPTIEGLAQRLALLQTMSNRVSASREILEDEEGGRL